MPSLLRPQSVLYFMFGIKGIYWVGEMKIVQLFSCIAALILFFIFKPHYVFLFFGMVSLLSLVFSYIISYGYSNPFNGKVVYNLEYLSLSSLMLSCLGILIDNTSVSVFYSILGILMFVVFFKRHKKLAFDEDFLVILLSIVGFWTIYYKFINLNFIAFLLALNVALLIGFLSHMLLEELKEEKTKQ